MKITFVVVEKIEQSTPQGTRYKVVLSSAATSAEHPGRLAFGLGREDFLACSLGQEMVVDVPWPSAVLCLVHDLPLKENT